MFTWLANFTNSKSLTPQRHPKRRRWMNFRPKILVFFTAPTQLQRVGIGPIRVFAHWKLLRFWPPFSRSDPHNFEIYKNLANPLQRFTGSQQFDFANLRENHGFRKRNLQNTENLGELEKSRGRRVSVISDAQTLYSKNHLKTSWTGNLNMRNDQANGQTSKNTIIEGVVARNDRWHEILQCERLTPALISRTYGWISLRYTL